MDVFKLQPIQVDFAAFRDCIQRKGTPKRVHFFEFYLDRPIKEELARRLGFHEKFDDKHPFSYYEKEIALQKFLGYDMLNYSEFPCFPQEINSRKNIAAVSEDVFAGGPIKTWNDFEQYPWPEVSDLDMSPLDWLQKELPDNMKCFAMAPIGLYKMLLGYEDMLYMMYDNLPLMKAVMGKLLGIFLDYVRIVCQYSCVGVVFGSDDMGFRTQTFFPPDFIRDNILPMHQALAQVAHDNDKLYFLHACGNLSEIMDDLIDSVKVDAKHSFEDAIMPVTEMKKIYGDRLALLGGMDVDFLCRSDEAALRKKVREILEICLVGGGYCLGSGNSIAQYVPLSNYLIMLDEGRKFKF
ncbi:MAG: hypothetical protein A2020_03105 [Lentisphaerae bacterium GWF2_45_14]|nr:MAG: hypothetical protein A2020_03105 [Lentisphaerae bacterium GWF2_45_14]